MVIKSGSFVLLLVSSLAFSETKTVGDLDKIQGETAYYQALTNRNKAMATAKEYNASDDFNVQSVNSGSGSNKSNARSEGATSLPVIEKIMGSNISGMIAKLRFADNTTSSVKQGDSIGSFKVISISIDSVKLSDRDGKIFTLRRSS